MRISDITVTATAIVCMTWIIGIAVADETEPYKDGFPKPGPYSGEKKGIKRMKFVENDEGLTLRSEKSYAESHQHVAEYLRDSHMPALRKMGKLPEAEIAEIEKRGTGTRPTDAGLHIHENLIYATWGKRAMVLDLYVPQSEAQQSVTKKIPVVLVIHGGSWHRNSHRTYRHFAMKLAKLGYATACVEYRLTGEAIFPAAIYDVKAATRWVRAHAAQYHLDPARIGITGASAGGNIAALAVVTRGDQRFEGKGNHLGHSSDLQCLVSMDGVIDHGVRGAWINDSKDDLLHRETSPYYHVVNRPTDLPPMLFISGGKKTYEWIKKNRKDVPVEFLTPHLPHAYELVDGEQKTVITWLDRFFKKHL